jgi:magnesium chelatase family protein
MNIAKAYCAHIFGLDMETIIVEVDISNGLHSFSIVGLGDRSVEEAKDRVSAAIKNTGFISPKQKNQKVVISLAPADVRKEGSSFDLAIAMAYLKGSGDIDFEFEHTLFLGELSLEGGVRKVNGLLPILIQASKNGFTTAFVPYDNYREATLAKGIIIYAARSLREVIDHIERVKKLSPVSPDDLIHEISYPLEHDISLIKGNESAKRAIEIAVAGCHNVILYGPPGTGKTMLAQSIRSIIPSLSYEQSIEVTSIHSVARTLNDGLIRYPPFRSPHHTASAISILGGGTSPHPGEISLAHRGVLFLDEFPEFDRQVIEGLRQPLEEKIITVSRARGNITFPAQCILVASMNPCRCGKGKDAGCTCKPHSIEAYRRRISAPILDRIDIWIPVNKVDYEKLSNNTRNNDTQLIRERIVQARKIQLKRFDGKKYFNSEMNALDIEKLSFLENEAKAVLTISAERLNLSGRAFHRIIKVARTIADMEPSIYIKKPHVLEALQYRQKMI